MKIWIVTWRRPDNDDNDVETEIVGAYRSRAAAISYIHRWCNEVFSEEAGFDAGDRDERHAEIDKLSAIAITDCSFGPGCLSIEQTVLEMGR
jgi:hypothetical protein